MSVIKVAMLPTAGVIFLPYFNILTAKNNPKSFLSHRLGNVFNCCKAWHFRTLEIKPYILPTKYIPKEKRRTTLDRCEFPPCNESKLMKPLSSDLS